MGSGGHGRSVAGGVLTSNDTNGLVTGGVWLPVWRTGDDHEVPDRYDAAQRAPVPTSSVRSASCSVTAVTSAASGAAAGTADMAGAGSVSSVASAS
jgi:hypothetical protein